MIKLKPCPCCDGSNLHRLERTIGSFRIVCKVIECFDCSFNVYTKDHTEGVIESKWNTRPPLQDCSPEMYVLLKQFVDLVEPTIDTKNDCEAEYDEEARNLIVLAEKLLFKVRGEPNEQSKTLSVL